MRVLFLVGLLSIGCGHAERVASVEAESTFEDNFIFDNEAGIHVTLMDAKLPEPITEVDTPERDDYEVVDCPTHGGYWYWYVDSETTRGFGIVQVHDHSWTSIESGTTTRELKVFDWEFGGNFGPQSRQTWIPLEAWVRQQKNNGGPHNMGFVRVEPNPFEAEFGKRDAAN